MAVSEEQPLREWPEIAAFLKVHPDTAKKYVRPYIHYFGQRVAIYPSRLKELAESGKLAHINTRQFSS